MPLPLIPLLFGAVGKVGLSTATIATAFFAVKKYDYIFTAIAAALFTGVVITIRDRKKIEEAKTNGNKEGYKKASHEYEEKLKIQAERFDKERQDMQEIIKHHKVKNEKLIEMLKDAYRLLGQCEGLIKQYKETGLKPHQYIFDTVNKTKSFIKQVDKVVINA